MKPNQSYQTWTTEEIQQLRELSNTYQNGRGQIAWKLVADNLPSHPKKAIIAYYNNVIKVQERHQIIPTQLRLEYLVVFIMNDRDWVKTSHLTNISIKQLRFALNQFIDENQLIEQVLNGTCDMKLLSPHQINNLDEVFQTMLFRQSYHEKAQWLQQMSDAILLDKVSRTILQ